MPPLALPPNPCADVPPLPRAPPVDFAPAIADLPPVAEVPPRVRLPPEAAPPAALEELDLPPEAGVPPVARDPPAVVADLPPEGWLLPLVVPPFPTEPPVAAVPPLASMPAPPVEPAVLAPPVFAEIVPPVLLVPERVPSCGGLFAPEQAVLQIRPKPRIRVAVWLNVGPSRARMPSIARALESCYADCSEPHSPKPAVPHRSRSRCCARDR